jgi:hypothetical protein
MPLSSVNKSMDQFGSLLHILLVKEYKKSYIYVRKQNINR